MRTFPAHLSLMALAAAAIWIGCANYQLGTTLPPHLRTISVATFENASEEPNIESSITAATLREFQRDGQLKIKDPEEADILLTGTVIKYQLEALRANRNHPKSTAEYKAVLMIHIRAVERRTGKKIVEQNVSGSKIFDASGDLVSARRNILPDVSTDLARKIVDAVISAW